MTDNIEVSVFCLTYNHEPYIREAIESFLMQKTNFPFEIIIHDDASTDGTPRIIQEYAEKYPEIVKPIFQTENQYSKHGGTEFMFRLFSRCAKGKYLAVCDGDDYWTDPYKLQKQYDFMEKHPKCSLCGHRALLIGQEDNRMFAFPEQSEEPKQYSVEEILMVHGGTLIPGDSLFFRPHVLTDLPGWCGLDAGDYILAISGVIHGECYCLQDVMSVYRYHVPNSLTLTHYANNQEFRNKENKRWIQFFRKMNEYFDSKYEKEFDRVIRYREYHLYKHTEPSKIFQDKAYAEFFERDQRRKKWKQKIAMGTLTEKDILRLKDNPDFEYFGRHIFIADWEAKKQDGTI